MSTAEQADAPAHDSCQQGPTSTGIICTHRDTSQNTAETMVDCTGTNPAPANTHFLSTATNVSNTSASMSENEILAM